MRSECFCGYLSHVSFHSRAIFSRPMDQSDHEAVAAPKLNVVAINQLFCPHRSISIAIGSECTEAGGVAVFVEDVGAVFAHFGDANPREASHSVICEAVSACRALRIRSLRSIPGGVPCASLRRLFACSCRRWSSGTVCLKWLRCIALLHPLKEAGALPNSLSPMAAETGAVMSNFAHFLLGESIPQSKIGHCNFQIRPQTVEKGRTARTAVRWRRATANRGCLTLRQSNHPA
jgi:hypothetical protein